MKRILLVTLSVLLAVVTTAPSYASVDDFTIESYDIRYALSRNIENRSELLVTETIIAQFPFEDQNHGIERAIPQKYDGHSISLDIKSVAKADGSKWNYETYTSNDNVVVRIGDADTFVQGEQTYVITYTQKDVTKTFENTNSDEFYWDTNGTGWRVPIRNLSVSLEIDDSLAGSLTGNAECYQGSAGATDKCALSKQSNNYVTEVKSLGAGENVTLAVGFDKDTFADY